MIDQQSGFDASSIAEDDDIGLRLFHSNGDPEDPIVVDQEASQARITQNSCAERAKEYWDIVEGRMSVYNVGCAFATSTIAIEAALRMLNRVPRLTGDLADAIVMRGRSEHERSRGPHQRYMEWQPPKLMMPRIDRFSGCMSLLEDKQGTLQQIPAKVPQPAVRVAVDRMLDLSGAATSTEQATPSSRGRRGSTLRGSLVGVRKKKHQRLIACVIERGRDCVTIIAKPTSGTVVVFDATSRSGDYRFASFVEFDSPMKASLYLSRIFRHRASTDEIQDKEFNSLTTSLYVLNSPPRPSAYLVDQEEALRLSSEAEAANLEDLRLMADNAKYFIQGLFNPAAQDGTNRNAETTSRYSALLALLQCLWRLEWLRYSFVFRPSGHTAAASDSVFATLKMLLQAYARTADQASRDSIPLKGELGALMGAISEFPHEEPALLFDFMCRAMHSELVGSATMESTETMCGPNHSVRPEDLTITGWASSANMTFKDELERRKNLERCPMHGGFVLDLAETWECSACNSVSTDAQRVALSDMHTLTSSHPLESFAMRRAVEDLLLADKPLTLENLFRRSIEVGWRRPCPRASPCVRCRAVVASHMCMTCPHDTGEQLASHEFLRLYCTRCEQYVHSVDSALGNSADDSHINTDGMHLCDSCHEPPTNKKIDQYSTGHPVKTMELKQLPDGSVEPALVDKVLTICSRCYELDIMPPRTKRGMFEKLIVGKTYRQMLHGRLEKQKMNRVGEMEAKHKEAELAMERDLELERGMGAVVHKDALKKRERELERLKAENREREARLMEQLDEEMRNRENAAFASQTDPKSTQRVHWVKEFPRPRSSRSAAICTGRASVQTRLRRAPTVFTVSVTWGPRHPLPVDVEPLMQALGQETLDLSKVYHSVDLEVSQARYRLVAMMARNHVPEGTRAVAPTSLRYERPGHIDDEEEKGEGPSIADPSMSTARHVSRPSANDGTILGGPVRSDGRHVPFEAIVRSKRSGEWLLCRDNDGLDFLSWGMVQRRCTEGGSAPILLFFERSDVEADVADVLLNPLTQEDEDLMGGSDDEEEELLDSASIAGSEAPSVAASRRSGAGSMAQSTTSMESHQRTVLTEQASRITAEQLDGIAMGGVGRDELQRLLGITDGMEVEAERSIARSARKTEGVGLAVLTGSLAVPGVAEADESEEDAARVAALKREMTEQQQSQKEVVLKRRRERIMGSRPRAKLQGLNADDEDGPGEKESDCTLM